MHNLVLMKFLKSKHKLRHIELHCVFRESLYLKEILIQVSSSYIVKEEVNPSVVLEDIVHS
jgi:hypothetical protein